MRLPILFATMLAGCGPRVCGIMQIQQVGDDLGFDRDGDGDVDLVEACGATAGSFAIEYPEVGATEFGWSWSFEDIDTDLLVASVWAPAGATVVWTDDLVPGQTITADQARGNLIMTPTGNDYDAANFTLGEFELTVNDVRPGRLAEGGEENTVFDVTWHLTFIDGAAPAGSAPYAVLDGTDEIRSFDGALDWDYEWNGPLPPE